MTKHILTHFVSTATTTPMTILFHAEGWDLDYWFAQLHEAMPGRQFVTLENLSDPASVDYALLWKPPAHLFDGLTELKVIFSLGAGVDHILSNTQLPADIPLVRVIDPDLTNRMSEYVTFHTLLHHRRHLHYADDQRNRTWKPQVQHAACDVRVGILGLGELGNDAAIKLKMLGFDVAGWSRTPKTIDGIKTFAGESELSPFLARTDILVVLLPLTDATKGIIDDTLLKGLARDGVLGGPVLINAGRGGLQVEADIVRALDDDTLGAASLDVFETEPLPAESPLWDRENVVITPHNAADSDPSAICRYIAKQIAQFEKGEPLDNIVDRARGY